MKEKTYVEEIDRSMYDFRNEEKDAYKVKKDFRDATVGCVSGFFVYMLYSIRFLDL